MTATRRNFLALAGAGIGTSGFAAAQAKAGAPDAVHILTSYVVGTDRYDAPLHAGQLTTGQPVRLQREPQNGYDILSVSVWTTDGDHKLGYIPRIHNQALAHLMDAGHGALAHVATIGGEQWRPAIGVSIAVSLNT